MFSALPVFDGRASMLWSSSRSLGITWRSSDRCWSDSVSRLVALSVFVLDDWDASLSRTMCTGLSARSSLYEGRLIFLIFVLMWLDYFSSEPLDVSRFWRIGCNSISSWPWSSCLLPLSIGNDLWTSPSIIWVWCECLDWRFVLANETGLNGSYFFPLTKFGSLATSGGVLSCLFCSELLFKLFLSYCFWSWISSSISASFETLILCTCEWISGGRTMSVELSFESYT